MSRGEIDESVLAKLFQQPPRLSPRCLKVMELIPDLISIACPPDSTIPIAAPCFTDAIHTFNGARFALRESHAHHYWHTERRNPPDLLAANFFGVFFADDCALRAYAAGEHLSSAIIAMLGIRPETLPQKRRVSLQSKLANWLQKNNPKALITSKVKELGKSGDWQKVMEYRNRWVHSEPTRVAGLGIVYSRVNRRIRLPNELGSKFTLGGGDPPEITLENLNAMLGRALTVFADTLSSIVEEYLRILEERKIFIEDSKF